jgi:hypothetical protein
MTIQRRYTLPNCNLILQGLGAETDASLTALMNAECHLPGLAAPLTGGKVFLQNLVAAVSDYTQSILSGLPRPSSSSDRSISLTPVGDYHCLTVQPEEGKAASPIEVKLTTVQLFDLVEVVDQFLADRQTLPDLSLSLTSLSRRQVAPQEPLAQRLVPATLGATALAAAAVGLYLLPEPDWQPPDPDAEPAAQTSDAPAGGEPPDLTAEANGSATPVDAASAAEALDQQVENAPAITDADTLETLQADLVQRLGADWDGDAAVDQDLVYRVAVAANGDVVGYRYLSDAALAAVDQTPLPRVTFLAVDPDVVAVEPLADFRVTFTPAGAVDVEPWGGNQAGATESTEQNSPTNTATPVASSTTANTRPQDLGEIDNEITASSEIESLNTRLGDAIRNQRERASSYDENLEYRVRLNQAGELIGYEATNAVARRQVDDTPLPNLVAVSQSSDDPQADFRVVFRQNGVLEVSPWRGWPD